MEESHDKTSVEKPEVEKAKKEEVPLGKWLSQPGVTRFFKHIILVAVLIGIIIAAVFIFYYDALRRAESWACHDLKFYKSADTAVQEFDSLTRTSSVANAGKAQLDRLRDQYGEVRNHARFHIKMAVSFHTRYYMVMVMAAMMACLASALLLFISKEGWSKISSYVITMFVILAAAAAFFGLLPRIFNYQANINANTQLYLFYRVLEYRIASYVATGTNFENKRVEISNFIHTLDNSIAKTAKYPLDYNPSEIPDIQTLMKQMGSEGL
jgi:predicted PurR-regulated permease PerM